MMGKYFWITAVAGGVLSFLVLLTAVLMAGLTHGQRCSVQYEQSSEDWQQCVCRLMNGGQP